MLAVAAGPVSFFALPHHMGAGEGTLVLFFLLLIAFSWFLFDWENEYWRVPLLFAEALTAYLLVRGMPKHGPWAASEHLFGAIAVVTGIILILRMIHALWIFHKKVGMRAATMRRVTALTQRVQGLWGGYTPVDTDHD